jgi:hypothetical protein
MSRKLNRDSVVVSFARHGRFERDPISNDTNVRDSAWTSEFPCRLSYGPNNELDPVGLRRYIHSLGSYRWECCGALLPVVNINAVPANDGDFEGPYLTNDTSTPAKGR